MQWNCAEQKKNGRVVADLTRATESPREVTNEHTSLSTYDVTPAQHPRGNDKEETSSQSQSPK
ncbi:hypothetical protein EYF80_011206 [Liparis tanakae]|uniref:Uncharacterized protein n=1 Tax=Liparis tanakae TaxID=230148 RepID=A0A4Z2ILF0_9TELE|nr:hypothetical protein EYF80_011206 [Liparis tanakae]